MAMPEKLVAQQIGPRQKRSRPGAGAWRQNPEGVRRNILDVARAEFAENGLSGARVDAIAARTTTSKRMIYHYFESKERLYQVVLEEAYGHIRNLEKSLDLALLPPAEALAALAGFTFDYHAENPDFVRLVMIENIHHAVHLKDSSVINNLNLSAIAMVAEIYGRGVKAGAFRPGLKPIDIHLMISGLSFYNVSNRATISQVFGHDTASPRNHFARRSAVIETILRYVMATFGKGELQI